MGELKTKRSGHWLLLLAAFGYCAFGSTGAAVAQSAGATTYYVSRSTGNDDYDGLAPRWNGVHGPWKTLTRASEVTYQPGDRLLLKCGDIWDETLTLKGDGTPQNPITVSSYGTGERPYIRRTLGKNEQCIVLDNAAGYRIRGLELGYALNAIHVRMDAKGRTDYDYYRFEDCFIHDIQNPTFLTSGGAWGWAIWFEGSGIPRNISVVDCIGLRTQGFFTGTAHMGNVTFARDTVSHGSLNQVNQTYATDFDINDCVFVYNYPWQYDRWGTTQVLAGILKGGPGVRYDVENNEFGWPGDYPGSPDGCGYDFEVSTADVTFSHNFVHDSFGEGVLFMGDRVQKNLIFSDNIFRNNVRFTSRGWTCTISLPLSVTGSGVFSHNVFYLWPGRTAFGSLGSTPPIQRPTDFTYVDNNEHPTKPFVAMPLVTHIAYRNGERIYTLASATPGATIHYTTDAGLPTQSSPVYTHPIVIRRSGVLNAKAFKKGYYPSYVNSLAINLRVPKVGAPSAWWKLNETSGRTVRDFTGDNNGQLTGASWMRGKGLAFNGRNASVTLHNHHLAAISNTFTISFWAKPAAYRPVTPEVGSGMGMTDAIWWKRDKKNGDALAESKGGARGRLIGGARTVSKLGRGLRFNGVGDSVAFRDAGLSKVADTFTISFWADPTATRADTPQANIGISGIAGQRYALGPQQYSAASGGAGVGVSVGTNGVSVFELADSYLPSPLVYNHPLTGWNNIVVVYRNKQPSLYINGALVKTGLKSHKTVHPDFDLGGSEYGWYQGNLDDVRVYRRALNEAEIRELVAQGEATPVKWTIDKMAGTRGLPFALGPIRRGGGTSADNAGVGVAVGTNGISVCESSDAYLPSVLVDTQPIKGWNQITIVYHGGQPTLYLNGIFETVGCRSEKTVHPVFDLGGGHGLGWYRGNLADVRVYDRALTDAEVQALAAK